MPRVLCKLPNASENINGVPFVSHADGGMVSADISDEQAAAFASIPGYSILGAEPEKTASGAMGGAGASVSGGAPADDAAAAAAAAQAQADADELAKLRARGVELAIPNAAQMGLKRLRDLVPQAEKAAVDAAAASGQQPNA